MNHITAPPDVDLARVADLSWADDRPVSFDGIAGSALAGRVGVGLVEVVTAREQRARTSQAYVRSSVGSRLRYVGHEVREVDGLVVAEVDQVDPLTGLATRTRLTRVAGARAVQVCTTVTNGSADAVVLMAVSSATVGLGASEADLDRWVLADADSEWLAENRWRERPLRTVLPRLDLDLHGQDGRGRTARTSHGSWSTGEHLPAGVVTDPVTGDAVAWQIETSGPWHWELAQTLRGAVLSLLGPTDLEHQFAHRLAPGESFETVPAAVAVSAAGRDGALGELTRLRRRLLAAQPAGAHLPVVYNDFMNTLMGQPSTEALLPLVDAAADAGAEYFCIDAGWFADPAVGDWWSTVGEWREAAVRFTGGLTSVIERIHARGMRSGLWLEPEVVGIDSPTAALLPDEAFFTRFGQRVQEDRRYHLDLRHPAARAHLDATVDHLVASYGVSYLKLDYNINPGVGTEHEATSAGDGLLAHTRALRDWLLALRARHPQVLVENCASGAMRADASLLAVTHVQSTSDQQDYALYPPIAASAPATILPEQCGNWAYPEVGMSAEETAFTLVTGLSGRLYLSGFLHRLRPEQTALVHEAVRTHTRLRASLPTAEPFWPLGLPGWDDPVVVLGLRCAGESLLFVWDRGETPATIDLPLEGTVETLFPADAAPWRSEPRDGAGAGSRLTTLPGRTARVLRLTGPCRAEGAR